MAPSDGAQKLIFFPKADAAVLSLSPPPDYPKTVGPIYDRDNVDTPCLPYPFDAEESYYPRANQLYLPEPAPVPDKHFCISDRYLRASLTKNERFRLSMLWYYTRDIFHETEFLSGLQEKVRIAQESTGWEFAIIGILDVNYYTRLATVGVPLGILPRGETICAHTVAQPPGSVFLLPNMLEDWRFEKSPYVESGGLRAYAGVPLRLQNETGQTACLGSLCVASPSPQAPLTQALQASLARLGDWVVSDIVHLTRARRQRARRQMVDLIATVKSETDPAISEEPVIQILKTIYPDATITLQASKAGHIEAEGRVPVPLSELEGGLWEDVEYMDQFIAEWNHRDLPDDRVVRIIAAQCESISGQSFLAVGTKDFRLVFDDIDAWFVHTCAGIISEIWHKRLLAEVMLAKEKFLRGFSHQLRTPVHGILGTVELLAEVLESQKSKSIPQQTVALLEAADAAKRGGEPSVYLDTIKSAGRDLISIINNMITLNRWADVAKTERNYATYTIYDLERELSNEILKMTSGDSRYNASVCFEHDLPPDQCSLWIDIGLLCDSLLPLIINAIQNTPKGNVIIAISARLDTKELVVDIKDTGRGIPPEDQERIFELYEQIDTHTSGSGIGLTLASKFAALLRGSIDLVSSDVHHGSHFRAKFGDVDLRFSGSSLLDEPLIPQLPNIPTRFHAVPSGTERSSLCDHFSKFLTCYGWTSSDDVEDTLIIVDCSTDIEQHRAVLSQLPADQAIVCLISSSDTMPKSDGEFYNVVYVEGPFFTTTMSRALVRAAECLSTMKDGQTVLTQHEIDLAIRPKQQSLVQNDSKSEKASHVARDSSSDKMSRTDDVTVDTSETPSSAPTETALDLQEKQDSTDSLPISIDSSGDTNSDDSTPPTSDSDEAHLTTPRPFQPFPSFPFPESAFHATALLVDDNAINLRIMQLYCEKRSVPYVCASDGLEAVSTFQTHQSSAGNDQSVPPIQVIFMDLQMPKCDGIEATRRIRQLETDNNWGQSTLFVVTGQDSATDRKAVAEVGAHEYYVKPVSMKSLDAGLKKYFPSFQAG
ncbi:unnamed protein product [Periconia digitata]|uniref:histidine kinase n=1 Tax=Periconia digitata TaxID=1303443 RepID=A0A9W4XZD8_9PLEO|nr:unnamed protein product [Periconia digitata]